MDLGLRSKCSHTCIIKGSLTLARERRYKETSYKVESNVHFADPGNTALPGKR